MKKIKSDTTKIQRIIANYYGKLYANQLEKPLKWINYYIQITNKD